MVIQCVGCPLQTEDGCVRYQFPDRQHTRLGGCAMRPKCDKQVAEVGFIDPLKASKRKARGVK